MPGCSMEHRILHEDVKTLLRRTDMSSVTVNDMLDKLEELGMEATFDSRETSILAMLVHMKNMAKEFTHRRREGNITLEETSRACEAIFRRLNDSHRNIFTDDLYSQSACSCRLSRGITSVLQEMKTNIERNYYYRNFCGMFQNHVSQIRSGVFDLRSYEVIVAIHNLHVAFYEILEYRLNALREFDQSTPSLDASPRDDFSLRLIWNTAQDSFKLQAVCKGGDSPSVIFHSSFLKIVSSSSARIWRNRRRLGAFDFSVGHSCSICIRDDFPISELTVLSCLLYTSPSPRDKRQSRMPSSA